MIESLWQIKENFELISLMSVKFIDDDGGPRLLSFPGGIPDGVEDLVLTFGEKRGGSKKRKQIVGDLNGLSFKAQDTGDGASKHNLCKYAVVKVNSKTNMIEIIPTPAVFVMRPQLGLGEEATPARLSGMTPDERRKSLTQEFGSSKKQRAVKQAASNQIQDETVQGANAVEKALQHVSTSAADNEQGMTLPDAAEQAMEQNRRLILPPYDEKAGTLAEAYPREQLMSTELYEELESYYDTLLPTDINDMKSKLVVPASAESVRNCMAEMEAPAIVTECINSLESTYIALLREGIKSGASNDDATTSTGGSSIKKKTINRLFKADMVMLLYLHVVLKFFTICSAKSQGGRAFLKEELLEAMKCPKAVTESLCTKFAAMSKRQGKPVVTVPAVNKDRLLCYVLVTGVHVSDNKFNLTTLSKDLRVNEAFLIKYVRQTGMKTAKRKVMVGEGDETLGSAEMRTLAILDKLPLTFPGPPRKQQGK